MALYYNINKVWLRMWICGSLKNSILESKNTLDKRNRFYIIIDCLKIKGIVSIEGRKEFDYLITWIIRSKEENKKNEIRISAKMLMHNENEYKVLLRSLIIGLVLIENNSDVFLEINKNVKRVLREFLDNLSNRRLDNEFFTELIFIEIFLKKMDMKIMECSNNERKILEEVRTEIRKLQALMSTNKLDKQAFEVLEEGLITNECNLFWKRNLIKGNYRGWRKKCTEAIWKYEILNSRKIEDLFFYNYKNEFDWER